MSFAAQSCNPTPPFKPSWKERRDTLRYSIEHEVTILSTLDCKCPGHVFTPADGGPWPGVILFMDGFGIRPTLFHMAQRLADGGYVVLLPDLFYRIGPIRRSIYKRCLPQAMCGKPLRR